MPGQTKRIVIQLHTGNKGHVTIFSHRYLHCGQVRLDSSAIAPDFLSLSGFQGMMAKVSRKFLGNKKSRTVAIGIEVTLTNSKLAISNLLGLVCPFPKKL